MAEPAAPKLATGSARGQSLLPLAALSTLCLAIFAATYAFWVRTSFGQRLDQDAFDGALAGHFARNAADDLLATISISTLVLAISFLALQALLRRRPTLALTGTAIIIASVGSAEVLKHYILERPDLLGPAYAAYSNSFPSGHATIAFSIGLAATLVAPPRLRRPVIAAAFVYSSLIGISTIAAGWHRPSDVVGALLLTTAIAAAVVLTVSLKDRNVFSVSRPGMQASDDGRGSSWPRLEVSTHYLWIGGLLMVTGLFIAVIGQAVDRIDRIRLPEFSFDFMAAISTVIALDAILIAAFLFALRRSLP